MSSDSPGQRTPCDCQRETGASPVRPTNAKLWARAIRIVRALSGLDDTAARKLIEKAGGRAKVAIVMHHARVSAARARELLIEHKGGLRAIIGDVEPGAAAAL